MKRLMNVKKSYIRERSVNVAVHKTMFKVPAYITVVVCQDQLSDSTNKLGLEKEFTGFLINKEK